jgi:rubrerythrin
MGVIARLVRLFDGTDRHYECRLCGRTLDRDEGSCPNCEGGVAVYDL